MKQSCYQPAISRSLIRALYFEGKRRGLPMTKLVDELLTRSLRDTPGWHRAKEIEQELAACPRQDRPVG